MASEVTQHHGDTHADGHSAGHHHITPPSVYLATFIGLLLLMVATIVVSKFNLGAANNAIAMAIAIAKAGMVVMLFMQVRYGTKLIWLWAGIGFVWFLLMFGITSDYITRNWAPVNGWEQQHDLRK
jgi:cytochrome c oxidase subunit 4